MAFCPLAPRRLVLIFLILTVFPLNVIVSVLISTQSAYISLSPESSVIPLTPRLVFLNSLTSLIENPREVFFEVSIMTFICADIYSDAESCLIHISLSSASSLVDAIVERLVSNSAPDTSLINPFSVINNNFH